MTIRDITIRTGYTFSTMFRIIHNELCMKRICARWIPHMIDEKRPGNTPSHRAAQTTKTIKRLGFELLEHPLTHQTWTLVFFFLFPLVKSVLSST